MNTDTLNPPTTPEDGTSVSGDTKTALIVDDRSEFLTLISPWLTALGYLLLTAADGKEAQGMMIAKGIASINLLITDLDMPRMQGDELARWFVRENPHARVLVMSGHSGDTLLPAGVVRLEKPFSHEAFIARLDELLCRADVAAVLPTFGNPSL